VGHLASPKRPSVLLMMWIVLGAAATGAVAQELTPRAYWPAPKGVKAVVVGYQYATGDVFFDPTVPLYGVNSNVNVGLLAYAQTFSLWGRTANVIVEQPYQWGTTQGIVVDTPGRRDFSAHGDLGVTLSANIFGAPSMSPREFLELRAHPHPILGASLKVVAPTGSYDKDRLINVGANRWAIRAELGYLIPLRPKWIVEMALGAWFLGDDDDFLPGKREQDPILAFQIHLVRRIRPGFWVSLDGNFFTGGRQTIAGNRLVDVQQNSRLGVTLVVPVPGRQAFKFRYAAGIFTEFGTDFDQYLAVYQKAF